MALVLAASGSSTGSILFHLVVQHLRPRIGFPRAVQVQGYITLGFAIGIDLLLRPRLAPRKAGQFVERKSFLEPTYNFFINTYATSIVGLPSEEAVNLFVVINTVGIPILWLTDYLDYLFLAIMLFVWIPIRSVSGLYVYSGFYGLATGVTQGMFVGGLASLTTRSKQARRSFQNGRTAGVFIQSDNGGFLKAHIWAGSVPISAALFVCATKWTQFKSTLQLKS